MTSQVPSSFIRQVFFLTLFADGFVRPLSTSIDAETLKALITINGAERVRRSDLPEMITMNARLTAVRALNAG